jgi:hypothetical protein
MTSTARRWDDFLKFAPTPDFEAVPKTSLENSAIRFENKLSLRRIL